jgi:catechol 2,3-dioxygenase-like lactoylglutathione lyase family enzyme
MSFRLDHVQLAIPAGGESIARTFYVEALGFDEVPKPDELAKRGGAWFRSGDVALHVGVDEAFAPAKKAHPALRCADYQKLLERLEFYGIAVTPDPLLFNGRPHCYISDPFGNRLELIG